MREGRRKLKVGQSGLAKWPARNSGGSRTKYRLRRHGHRPSPPWAVWALAHRENRLRRQGAARARRWQSRLLPRKTRVGISRIPAQEEKT